MQFTNDQLLAMVREGAEHLRAGRYGAARARLEQVAATGRANAQIWLLLATAARADGDPGASEAALDSLLALDPRSVRGHVMKGDSRASAGDERAAAGFYETALRHAEEQDLPADLAAEVERVRRTVAQWAARAESQRETTLSMRGFPPERRSERFARSLEILAGRAPVYVQQPTGYYFPGLPATPWFDPATFAWAAALEAAAPAIRAELEALLAGRREAFRPYLHGDANQARRDANALLDSPDWSALFLSENGVRNDELIAACPQTWAALGEVPLLAHAGAPTAMFSLLAPGARIAAHTGMFNTRLICHLPLIVPPGCAFRVGSEVREWEEGKLLIFDDTIEHEAWNDGASERVVLIFDVWRPDLSDTERREIAALFAAQGAG